MSESAAVDPLDEEICFPPFVSCRGARHGQRGDCKNFTLLPMTNFLLTTPRKAIEFLKSIGWTWEPGEKPTSGVPRCSDCSARLVHGSP